MKVLDRVLEVGLYAAVIALLGIVIYAGYRFTHKPLIAITNPSDSNKLSPVVRLTTPDGRTFCTGTVVNPNTIVTAAHCVVQELAPGTGFMIVAQGINIRAVDGKDLGISTVTVFASPQMDTAILEGDFRLFEPRAMITDVTKLTEIVSKGAVFTSCGYPLSGPLYCSKTKYIGRINFMWLVSGVLLPGMSGGPTMLEDGTVVAINDAVTGEFSVVVPTYNLPIR